MHLYLTKGIWIAIHYNYIIGTGVWLGQYERLMIKTYIYIIFIKFYSGQHYFLEHLIGNLLGKNTYFPSYCHVNAGHIVCLWIIHNALRSYSRNWALFILTKCPLINCCGFTWFSMDKVQSIIIPKFQAVCDDLIISPSRSRWSTQIRLWFRLLAMVMNSVLSLFSWSLLWNIHSATDLILVSIFRIECSWSVTDRGFTVFHNCESSAKKWNNSASIRINEPRGIVYEEYSWGPRMEPCGTAQSTVTSCEYCPSTQTLTEVIYQVFGNWLGYFMRYFTVMMYLLLKQFYFNFHLSYINIYDYRTCNSFNC